MKLVELDLFVLYFIQNYDLWNAVQLILRTLLRTSEAQITKKNKNIQFRFSLSLKIRRSYIKNVYFLHYVVFMSWWYNQLQVLVLRETLPIVQGDTLGFLKGDTNPSIEDVSKRWEVLKILGTDKSGGYCF